MENTSRPLYKDKEMGSNMLILRFRDPEETVDTISSHNSIIENLGNVRWGWWKKETEKLSEEQIIFFKNYTGKYVYLINRDLNKLYRAYLSEICPTQPSGDQLSQVPTYYRDSVDKVYMWFLFTKIELLDHYPDEYDSQFADMGNPTFIIANLLNKHQEKNTLLRKPLEKDKILVLSDLHFGEDYGFCLDSELHNAGQTKETLTRALLDDLQALKIENEIGLLVITGDFTTKGDWGSSQKIKILTELHKLSTALNIDKNKIIAVPGNHDIVRCNATETLVSNNVNKLADNRFEDEFRSFVTQLNGREYDKNLSYNDYYHIEKNNVNLDITILNSCKIVPYKGMSEFGSVGVEGIDTIRKLNEKENKNTQRIVFLHHHLLPVYDIEFIERQPSLSIDSVRILKSALSKNIKLAMHGHQHVFNMAKYNLFDHTPEWIDRNITVIANGSTSVSNKRLVNSERNSYSVLTINTKGINIIVREFRRTGFPGTTVLDHNI